jgi:peptide-methionine (S)-S-oxide reductase
MLSYRQLIHRISTNTKLMMNEIKNAPQNLATALCYSRLTSSWSLPSLAGLLLCGIISCPAQSKPMVTSTNHLDTATLGGGCFWCTEALFQMLPGVKSVTSGYAGGTKANPTYQEVCSGDTGHAEVIQIEFDPTVVTFDKILSTFWEAHDPTTLNRQGADHGTQYRSIILYNSEAQKLAAEKSKSEAQKHFSKPIVTEIVPLKAFYKAEDYHHDYYRSNPEQPYCRFVIQPKVEKFEKKLKDEH